VPRPDRERYDRGATLAAADRYTVMSSRVLVLAAVSWLLVATPALADRSGDAPIKAPGILKTDHVAFTLPGAPWQQIVGGLAGTPAFGRYALDTKLANGSACNLRADVIGKATKHPPLVIGRTVQLRPFSRTSEVLRVTHEGRHGAVRWWAGRMKGFDAAAGGVQRLPARLRTKRRRYLTYVVTIAHTVAPADERECAALARATGSRVARKIARTMHIADGPPLAKPPFTSA
jgi:hypothetical protein